MIDLSYEDMVDVNVAPTEIQQAQQRNFLQRLERNFPIHAKRAYRWANHPIGRYALYSTAIWIFPQHKVKIALRAARKFHGIIESSRAIAEDVKHLFD